MRLTATLWPGSLRLVLCAAALWALALLAPPPWVLLLAPVVGGAGFWCLRWRHHLGVGLIVVTCLTSIQVTFAAAARGPDEPTETSGILVGATAPGPSGWSRLTVFTTAGFAEVLAPAHGIDSLPAGTAQPDPGAHIAMRTERLDDIRITEQPPRMTRGPNALWRWRAAVRERLRDNATAAGHAGGALLPGLVVGDTDPQPAQMVEDMRVVSLTHVSAVSGTNVTIVCVGAGLLAGACRAGPRTRVSVGLLTCLGYVFLVGFEPSAIRAAGMAIAVALVFLRGGGISPVAVIAATVSLLLTGLPMLASSVGFVLSVVSTSAIMFVVPILLRRLSVRWPRAPAILVSALVVPLVAQLACTPVLVAIDPRLGGWSVVANALAAPAVLPATICGFVSLVTGGIGVLGVPVVPFLAEVSAWLGAMCAWWIVAVARLCAQLPGASLTWPDAPVGSIVALVLLAVLTLGVALLVRRHQWGLPVIVLAIALGAAVVVVGSPRPPARDWIVLVCDVGQGSAAVVHTGDGRGLVIDTGKDPGPIDECLDDSGIDEFDLAISHFDADHSAGWAGTLQSRRVGRLWVSANVAGAPEVSRIVGESGAAVVPVSRGRRVDLNGVGVEVLWPPARAAATGVGAGAESGTSGSGSGSAAGTSRSGTGAGSGTEARNEDSLVLRVDVAGLSVLLPGDIGEDEQFVLAQSLRPVDVLIAPHHGSGDLSADFYRAAGARLGAVSVGENRYGHPTDRSLRAFGPVPVLRTDRCGTIALYADGRYSTARDCER